MNISPMVKALTAIGMFLTSAASADTKIILQLGITNSKLGSQIEKEQKHAPKPLKLFSNGVVTETVSIQSQRYRIDAGDLGIIKDKPASKTIILIRKWKQYIFAPYDLPSYRQHDQVNLKLVPTPITQRTLGHVARKYLIQGSFNGTPVKGVAWTVKDLPKILPDKVMNGGIGESISRQVEGTLVAMTAILCLKPEPFGMTFKILSISHPRLPTSIFMVPTGYKRTLPKTPLHDL